MLILNYKQLFATVLYSANIDNLRTRKCAIFLIMSCLSCQSLFLKEGYPTLDDTLLSKIVVEMKRERLVTWVHEYAHY